MLQNTVRKPGVLGTSALLLLSLLGLTANQAFAQSSPWDVGTSNLVTTEEPKEIEIFDLKDYQKSRTQFDGVTNENVVTYLRIKATQGLEIPVMSTGKVNQNLDLTTMVWFKIEETAPEAELMYLFSFENSVACFFTNTRSIMCDSTERSKLQIASEYIVPGKWLHLTFSTKANGVSYIQLADNNRILGYDETDDFSARQNVKWGWKTCIGDCQGIYGFEGGIRELVVRNSYLNPDQAFKAKNMQFTYSHDFKAYFRFADVNNNFDKDEFVDRTWRGFIGEQPNQDYLIGRDLIPNDVCPVTFKQKEFVEFDGYAIIKPVGLTQALPQSKYAYSFSITMMVNETMCTTRNPREAAVDCNILKLDEVFMLYFDSPNMAKFHFFAFKNYYESQSRAFFIPHDQWITLQMSFTHYGGFNIAMVDQNGKTFYTKTYDRNMQEMRPLNRLNILDEFVGRVAEFQICQIDTNVPYVTSSVNPEDCMFILNFDSEGVDGNKILNKGTEPDLEFYNDISLQFNRYEQSSLGQNSDRGTYAADGVFDGISCDDLHITTKLDQADSFLRFQTPHLDKWLSENTIEFWFKFNDPAAYEENKVLFSMWDEATNSTYFEIFTQGGELICAPFGTKSVRDPFIAFSNFKAEKEDHFGWWHFSCGYSFQQDITGTLTNAEVSEQTKETLVAFPKYFPQESLAASFGQSQDPDSGESHSDFYVKEVRYWSQQLASDHIYTWMNRQIDPSVLPEGFLLTYLRLNSGSYNIQNFAEVNPFYNFTETNVTINEFSLIEEFSETFEYYYDVNIGDVVAKKVVTHHNVCPLYTFYKDTYCYSEPVNDLKLTVYPMWNSGSESLDWVFSTLDSSYINSQVALTLEEEFMSSDAVLQKALSKVDTKGRRVVESQYFRQESEYKVSASVMSTQKTFVETASINFVPSQCRWFDLSGSNAVSAYKEFEVSPGKADIKFNLKLKKNPFLDCTDFTFYDQFYTIDFDFVITDTIQYMEHKPMLNYALHRPSDNVFYNETEVDQFDGDLYINVTIPKDEQFKFPVFKDVGILMTIRWTNAEFQSEVSTDDLVFQNALYTMRFAPLDNELVVNLEVNQNQITRDQIVILDGSNSYVTNLPSQLRQKDLRWAWTCPQTISSLCENQTSSILSIPWEKVVEANVTFEYQYRIEMIVTWLKQDGTAEAERRQVDLAWYDMVEPQFDLSYSPVPVLVTDVKNTAFTINSLNFDVKADYRQYKIDWTIEPPLNNTRASRVLSGGAIMQVTRGNFAPNTLYTVSATVTYKALPILSAFQQVQFATKAPPSGGTVIVQPSRGYIGTPFTLVLRGWTSDYEPIVFDVYQTYNIQGTRKGRIINTDGPIPVGTLYQYFAKNVNPVIVEVKDESGEKLSFIMAPEISLETPPEVDGNVPEDNSTLEGTKIISWEDENTVNVTESVEEEVIEQPEEDVQPFDPVEEEPVPQPVEEEPTPTPTPEPEPTPEPVEEESTPEPVEEVSSPDDSVSENTNTTNLLGRIVHSQDQDMSKKVSYMARVAKSIEPTNEMSESGLDNSEQIAFREQILREMQKDIKLYSYEGFVADTPPTQFVHETLPIVRNLLTPVEYYNEDVASEAVKVIEALKQMDGCDFPESVKTCSVFRETYLDTLSNLSKFARVENSSSIRSYVQAQIAEVQDLLCASDVEMEYSGIQEVAFVLKNVDHQHQVQSFKINDVTYELDSNKIMDDDINEVCVQVTSFRGAPSASFDLYSDSTLEVTLFDLESSKRQPLSSAVDHTEASFEINPVTFRNNQTVCMAYSESTNEWNADLCTSEVNTETYSIDCSCNSFEGSQIGVFTDMLRLLDMTPLFPSVQVFEEAGSVIVEVPVVTGTEIKATSYVTICLAVLIAISGLIGSSFVMKVDNRDWNDLNKDTFPESQNFVKEVSVALDEPYKLTSYRMSSLMSYRSLLSSSLFASILVSIHPLVNSFATFEAARSRLLRFNAYLMQVIIYAVACYLYFGVNYRSSDADRHEEVLDQKDISSIMSVAIAGSFFLLPWLSEPISHFLSNKITVNTTEGETEVKLVTQRLFGRYAFIATTCLMNIGQLVFAIMQSPKLAGSNQYLTVTAFFTGLFLATFVTNLVRVLLNSCLVKKSNNCLLSATAVQVARDIRAVKAACKQLANSSVSDSEFMTNPHIRKQSEAASKAMMDEKNNHSPTKTDSARVSSRPEEVQGSNDVSLNEYSPQTEQDASQPVQKQGRFLQELVRRSADKMASQMRYSSIMEADRSGKDNKSCIAADDQPNM